MLSGQSVICNIYSFLAGLQRLASEKNGLEMSMVHGVNDQPESKWRLAVLEDLQPFQFVEAQDMQLVRLGAH